MKTLVFIPARLSSTRFPNKPLAQIANGFGESWSLVRHVYHRAMAAQQDFCNEIDRDGFELYVITTDQQIHDEVSTWNGNCILLPDNITKHEIRNGTERCFFALKFLGLDYNNTVRVINIQGDEYIDPYMLIELAKQWLTYRLATLAAPLDIVNHSNDPNTVKVVFDVNSKAMYFSRSNIPYCSQEVTQGYQHLGLYMYSVAQLRHYVTLQPTIGENTEKLEQLRFIENGFTMGISVTNLASVSVNQFSDIAKLEAHILASTS